MKLQSAKSKVHLSLDIWTSPNRLLLLGVCSHFVDHAQEARRKALLALRPVANHSGEQFVTLLPILRDFVSTYLKEEGVKWDPEVHRLRCLGHVINLAVQAFLFQNSIDLKEGEICEDADDLAKVQRQRTEFRRLGPLGKLHNLVVNIRSSSGRSGEFMELAERAFHLTIQETASALDTYTKNHFEDLSADFLLPEDWAAPNN
ncbi:ribonuclease H-like protein [Hirsutella rhossiliensis]